MTEVERILDQLKRAYEGNAWHGPSVREALEGITAEQATKRPLANAHSIWELAHHIAVWESACVSGWKGIAHKSRWLRLKIGRWQASQSEAAWETGEGGAGSRAS